MLFVLAVGVALVVGWILRGSVAGIVRLRLVVPWFLPLPFLLRSILFSTNHISLSQLAADLQLVSYIGLLIWCVLNYKLPGSSFLILGTALNALVVYANHGRMPVSEAAVTMLVPENLQVAALSRLVEDGGSLTHTLLTQDTRFPLLADVIPVPLPWYPSVVSVGDLLLVIGVVWVIVSSMVRGNPFRAEGRVEPEKV